MFVFLSVIALLGLGYVLVLRVARNHDVAANNSAAIDRNARALAYICSTTSVLDKLVITAHDQIETSLSNGTYQRLEKKGVVTDANIRSAEATVKAYAQAHRTLLRNGACRDLNGR